ncbi:MULTISPECIES: adenosylcobinamide-phosphate synthase CbiB [Sphingomonas]|uniref:adenosylcobinamide-phosphate synthase CbiB n=1 Tax=Sphingomonas TaxID=13687 RepID=UPI00083500D0|nr:adenosylcobinamide-phosphate synthase CbiB [Sphingomonas sp. CCH10-B3]
MNGGALLLAVLVVEAAIGWPRRWWHPVMAAGAAIAAGERWLNFGGSLRRRALGLALVAVLATLAAATGWAIQAVVGHGWGWALVVLIATTGLAQRSLHDHVAEVLEPLSRHDLAAARQAVAMIVGRDVEALDARGVATAAVESLAESFGDGVVAPAFWLLVGGLPGLFVFKLVSTADSMIGHRTDRLAAFGWAAARADDVMNWVPARLAGVLVCAVGGGWRVMVRDARAHASPNAGWPEAAMAGALGVRLGGPVSYDGEPSFRPAMGDGAAPTAADLARGLAIYRHACLLLWLIAGGFAWLL